MSDNIIPGSTNISVEFLVPTVVAITDMRIGSIRSSIGDGTSFVETAAGSNLTALASITTAHTDNRGIYLSTNANVGNKFLVRADFPDSHFASGKDRVICTLYDGDLNIAAREFTLEAAPATLQNQVDIESKIDDMPTNSEFNARTLTSGTYGTLTNQTNIETKVDDIPTNSEFNARTLTSGTYGTVSNQTNIETKIDDVPTNSEFNARTLTSGTYATLVKQNDQYTLVDTRIGTPYELSDGSTLSSVTEMLSEMGEQVSQAGTFDRSVNSLESLAGKLDNVGLVGTAINSAADTITITSGSIVGGTVNDTKTVDQVYQQIDDAAGTIDFYYEFSIGGTGIPVNGLWTGRLNGSNDDVVIQAYDWDNTTFEQVAQIAGQNTSADGQTAFTLFPDHVGTGANLGLVRIRFLGTGLTAADLFTDQLLISFASLSQSVGYSLGAVWVDTINGTAGTESFVNGTADNPSLTWADAQTISSNVGLVRCSFAPNSTITLDANTEGKVLFGNGYHLDLNGFSISGTQIRGAASVTGIGTGAIPPTFFECGIGDVTLPPSAGFQCGFFGTFTVGSEGHYTWGGSATVLPSGTPAVFDFGSALNASTFIIHSWGGGGLEIENSGAGTGSYAFEMAGLGSLIINANCSATTLVKISGSIDITDNATGITFDLDSQTIPTSIDDELSTVHGAGLWTGSGGGGGDATEAKQDIIIATLGTPANIDSGGATIADNLKVIVDDAGGTTYSALTDSMDIQSSRQELGLGSGFNTGNHSQVTIANKINDVPTVAEFNARTVLASVYATLSNQTAIEGKIDLLPTLTELEARTILSALYGTLSNQNTMLTRIGSPINIDFGGATLADNLKKLADDSNGTSFNAATDSQEAIRNAITAGGGGVDIISINGSTASAVNLQRGAFVLVLAAATAGTLTVTEMTTDLTETTDGHYNGRVITWSTGDLAKQSTNITAYDGTTKKLTFGGITEPPAIGDAFVIS